MCFKSLCRIINFVCSREERLKKTRGFRMDTINKLEKKFGRFSIPYLYAVMIACIIIGYFIRYGAPGIYQELLLIPSYIVLKNQYWRLFTWIFTIPYEIGSPLSLIFLAINMFFYYYLGRSLEMYWGRFVYNLYIIGGALFTDICVLIGAFYYYVWSPNAAAHIMDMESLQDSYYAGVSITHYMLMSIFLAFTVVGGDHVIYIYFILPVKMKWLGYMDLLILAYYFATGGFFTRIIIFCSVANYFVYFLNVKRRYTPSISDLKRKHKFSQAKKKSQKGRKHNVYNPDGTISFSGKVIQLGTGNPEGISIHKCAVCGKTEKDDPNLEFRFCSKCNGNYEYCSDHLYTHQHVQ